MNQREAKRWACSVLGSRALHAAADADESLPEADDLKVTDQLYVLAIEMFTRAGEEGQAESARIDRDQFRATAGWDPVP